MALKLIANYSKRLGLPGYSSHQFSVCVEKEISSGDDVAGESSRLYQQLQESVDREIQITGFVPSEGYGQNGSNGAPPPSNGNGSHNGDGQWSCTEKQRALITKIVEENHLDKEEIEAQSKEQFAGRGVKELSKLQASCLIDELLERVAQRPSTVPRNHRRAFVRRRKR